MFGLYYIFMLYILKHSSSLPVQSIQLWYVTLPTESWIEIMPFNHGSRPPLQILAKKMLEEYIRISTERDWKWRHLSNLHYRYSVIIYNFGGLWNYFSTLDKFVLITKHCRLRSLNKIVQSEIKAIRTTYKVQNTLRTLHRLDFCYLLLFLLCS
jgi:hypothetical protein